MKISVMITTRNRCPELERTLGILRQMSPPPDEMIITADGCEDGTVDMVQNHFPQCRLIVNSPGQGSVPSRHRMLHEATGDLVLSLDDDSYPVSRDFFARLPALFEEHPEAAVITFPELRDGDIFWPASKSSDSPGHYVPAYPNGAAAMRRDVYLQTRGFPGFFIHAYEEPDYALQCISHGMAVWFEPSLVIRHHYSPINRDQLHTHHFNARNELWSVWMRCPWPWLPVVSLYRILRQFCYASSQGWRWLIQEPRWWWAACKGIGMCGKERQPIPWNFYYGWMIMARHPIHQREAWMRRFRPSEITDQPSLTKLVPGPCVTCSIMITTRNRCADLQVTAERITRLSPEPLEVLVCLDGCTDGTEEMLRRDYPQFIIISHDKAQGSVRSRDLLIRRAKGDIVISLDDDSYPLEESFLGRLPALFAAHPEAAVITFPEQRDGGVYSSSSKTPETKGHYVSAYPNCAAAMLRTFYLQQPGFPPFFSHMYEEPDYALQCYAAGSSVWFEPALVVRHHLSPSQRHECRRHHLNARNELWSVWMRCPWPWLPFVSLFRIWRQFRHALTQGVSWAAREPVWWWEAIKGWSSCLAARRPVPWNTYYAWMRLARRFISDKGEMLSSMHKNTSSS